MVDKTLIVPVKKLRAIVNLAQDAHTLTHRLANDEVTFDRVDKAFEILLDDLDALFDEHRQRVREAKVRAGKAGGAARSAKKLASGRQNVQLALARRRRNLKIRRAERTLRDEKCPDCGGELSREHVCTQCRGDWGDWPGWKEAE